MSSSRRSAFASYVGPQHTPVVDRSILQELSDAAVIENQACARKVRLAASIWDSCIHQNVQVGDVIMDAGSYAASETAKALGCSKAVADTYAEIGMDLRLRLARVRAAFDAGELDLARVRAIYRNTNSLSLEVAVRIESEILNAARRLSPGPLATEICEIVQRVAPEEAAALRKDLVKLTRVRYRDRDMIATIEADLEAGDAAACWQLVNEMANTLCRRDPRTRGQRLAAAYVALMHQETFVSCTCEQDEDDPCTARRELPDRRSPLTTVTIDLPTLAGLADLPGYLAGHGLIDADYARELAANGDWQLLLTEAADLAASLGLVDVIPDQDVDVRSERGEGDGVPDQRTGAGRIGGEVSESCEPRESEGAGEIGGPSESDEAVQIDREGEIVAPGDCLGPGTETGTGTGIDLGEHTVLNPLGHGRRRRGLHLPKRPAKSQPCTTVPNATESADDYTGSYTLVAHIEEAVAANPARAEALHPDGHGGFLEPPDGALTYRPSSELAKCVRQRDRTCRHPGCDVPAAACEIDHVVPYRHYDPKQGGWTVLTNLHCLCRYHHMLKTMGVWVPVMLSRGIDYWTSSSGSTAITLPGGTVGTTDLSGCRLIPHIPRKRRPHCSPQSANKNKPDAELATPYGPGTPFSDRPTAQPVRRSGDQRDAAHSDSNAASIGGPNSPGNPWARGNTEDADGPAPF
ncbi:HNH endonuclease signature motif containing protein [Rhodococcus sp. 1168]|uniref:HNH endonuclease signature motif containing protein n=1 Tax=Rhodococcus sp. 1168 TaxID=2018041 RepID=UPI000A0A3A40|nr:HNH endonuclease signature motif containing protein [Rhodococcus sp. 1168]ORI23922.1 hypothetical protein BJI47_15730 [Rhodococcus sp. 1168]